MMGYNMSIIILLLAIVLVALALIGCIVALQDLSNNSINAVNTNVSFVKAALIYGIVIFSIMLFWFLWGLWKIRTSNMGEIVVAIIALILVIIGIVLFSIALSKTNYTEFPFVVKALSFAVIMLPLTYFLAVISVYMKPKITSSNMIKKVAESVKEIVKSEKVESTSDTSLVEIDGSLYAETSELKPVQPVVKRVQKPVVPVQQVVTQEEDVVVGLQRSPGRVVVSSPQTAARQVYTTTAATPVYTSASGYTAEF
jgi:hypothetical protein